MEKAKSLRCFKCKKLLKDYLSSSCCGLNFCKECTNKVAQLPCQKCQKRSFAWKTASNSVQIVKKCKIDRCSFKGSEDEFLAHLIFEHKKEVISLFDKNIKFPYSSQYDKNNQEDDLIGAKTNKGGRIARLGSTKKYYCGGKLDGPVCYCCNGYCGPTNGCNCSACMDLDIKTRKLPEGYWVNKEGAISKKAEDDKLYCGRKIDRYSDKYCEKSKNVQCNACSTLQVQLPSRYAIITAR